MVGPFLLRVLCELCAIRILCALCVRAPTGQAYGHHLPSTSERDTTLRVPDGRHRRRRANTCATAWLAGADPTADARAGAPGQGRGRGGGGRKDDPINADVDWTKQPPVLPKTPEEELKQFILQPGYRLELVLADPIIQEPTAIAFDGNGRMFVVEDRSYMLDLDMTGQLDPISRISLHVDTDNDGVYDKHTVFVDNLVFPRFVTPFGPGAILTKESNADEVWKYTDTNGDGVADKKELFDTGYGRLGNVEGQEAFLTWTLDNWMYSTYNAFRARWTPHGVIKEPTGSNGGEWGVTQDNDGKIWFESGAPGVPSGFQFPIVYGNFNVPDQFEPDFRIPWGAPIRIADMQGGMGATRMPDGSLKSVTASAGNDVYRGHRLPKDLVGDLLSGEPVGRIIRRIRAENKEGLTILHNVYPSNEFIKSLDPFFRPVDVTTAPDGTVYITDMYHGIIQVGNFTGPGTYLRARVEQYDLDKVIHKGRIWRLVYDGVKPDRSDALRRDRIRPRMNDETPAQLVAHLSHPNGWWRDTAQQLLILKQNKSVVPALRTIVKTSSQPARALPCAVDARGPRRASAGARPTADGGSRASDAHPGDPRQRDALQGGRQVFRKRLQVAHQRSEHRRRDSSDADPQPLEGPGLSRHHQGDDGEQSGARSAGRGVDDVESSGRSRWCAADAGAAGGDGSRRGDLQRAVLRLPRTRRQGHTETRARDDDGPAAGGIAEGQRAPRLHHQGRAAWIDRPDRRPVLHGRDDADGRQQRRLGCCDRILRATQLRQQQWLCFAGRCCARARRDERSQNELDDSRADRLAAIAAPGGRLESDGKPQSG